MLTLSERASTVVRTISGQHEADDAGLRIAATDEAAGSLGITVTPDPEPGDTVVEADGARVFVDQSASELLSDMVLDAQVDEQGNVEFALGPQQTV
ncbi:MULTISPECIES: HesB/IscA family protein [Desertihabitans]|uniref:Fe-S cluster assembly protein HesB n=1 Tax=Desertihabitans brevis TaxID=2268447 RepID=A0A367YQE1_9ACTN|nr:MULTISPECIES: Fe-S cluster assembly protein HesB [Desertihabitans]RCK68054.1 Fe-S cluster assembly protein HesB [Desertihabitans brevis]